MLQVGPKTNLTTVECICNHTTAFGGGWSAIPTRIDFNYVFAHVSIVNNPTIYATLIGIICIYFICIVIARHYDIKDREKVNSSLLSYIFIFLLFHIINYKI